MVIEKDKTDLKFNMEIKGDNLKELIYITML